MGCLSSLLCFILTVWYLFWSLDHNLNNSIISSDAMIIIVPTLDESCATELVCKMFLGLNLWNLLIMVVISVVILFGMRLNYTQILCIFYSHILGMYCLRFLNAGSFQFHNRYSTSKEANTRHITGLLYSWFCPWS